METEIPSETLVIICQSIWRHIPEHLNCIFINTDVTTSNLADTDRLFPNPSIKITEKGQHFDRKYSSSKFMCCDITLIIGRPLLWRKEPKHVGKRLGGSEEIKDSRGCSMHIVFQEVHNILKFRDRALEPSPVWTDSFGIQMLLTPYKTLLHRHVCCTKLPWKLLPQCHGLWCDTGLPHTPATSISWFQTCHWWQSKLIQETLLSSKCGHSETGAGSYSEHEQARAISKWLLTGETRKRFIQLKFSITEHTNYKGIQKDEKL
jgi:hypothetical protein